MNSLVVYFSKFGNTHTVAETIANELRSSGSTQVVALDDLSEEHFRQVDLVVMGAPTHKMNLPETARPLLDALPRNCFKGIRYAAFDTSYELSRWLQPFTAGKRLSKKMRKLGGTKVMKPEIFTVQGREGPLCDGEQERAGAWAKTILAECSPPQQMPAVH